MKRYGAWELGNPGHEDDLAHVTIRYPRQAGEKFHCKVIGAQHDKHPQLSHRNSAEFACDNLSDAVGWIKSRIGEYTRRGWQLVKISGRAEEIHQAQYNIVLLQPQPDAQAA